MYKRIADYLDSHPEAMVGDNKEGVERAQKGMYAFFMESTSIEYETERKCDLAQVGNPLDDKGYGIAMRKSEHLLIDFNAIYLLFLVFRFLL